MNKSVLQSQYRKTQVKQNAMLSKVQRIQTTNKDVTLWMKCKRAQKLRKSLKSLVGAGNTTMAF